MRYWMSKGFVLYAKGDEYINQACLCAMSLQASNNTYPISLITNDTVEERYRSLFDKIIQVPWDTEDDTRFQTNSRWKIYHASPYDQTTVLDTDILVMQNLDTWWKFLENYNLYYVTKAYTYRKELITTDYYRKAFVENKLPNIYTGMHYFKKSEVAHEFYKWLELISNNWELFYGQFCQNYYPKQPSMDISVAIASKIMNNDNDITNANADFPVFVHMKPHAQKWKTVKESWQTQVGVYLNKNLELKIGNHIQDTVFHYTENSFVNDKIMLQYEQYLGI